MADNQAASTRAKIDELFRKFRNPPPHVIGPGGVALNPKWLRTQAGYSSSSTSSSCSSDTDPDEKIVYTFPVRHDPFVRPLPIEVAEMKLALKWPCRDETALEVYEDGSVSGPSRTLDDVKKPKLRKCPFQINTDEAVFVENLGGGYDGNCWKVKFKGDDKPYVLKLFWEHGPNHDGVFSFQQECRTAAILQIVRSVMADAEATGKPILQLADPVDWHDHRNNLYQFTDEMRQVNDGELGMPHLREDRRNKERQKEKRTMVGWSPAESLTAYAIRNGLAIKALDIKQADVPRLRQAYGWCTVTHTKLRHIRYKAKVEHVYIDKNADHHFHDDCYVKMAWTPEMKRAKYLRMPPDSIGYDGNGDDKNPDFYYCILYEYIEPGPCDIAGVDAVANFLAEIGIGLHQLGPRRNWTSNVLLDQSDVPTLYDRLWSVNNLRYKGKRLPVGDLVLINELPPPPKRPTNQEVQEMSRGERTLFWQSLDRRHAKKASRRERIRRREERRKQREREEEKKRLKAQQTSGGSSAEDDSDSSHSGSGSTSNDDSKSESDS